MASPRKGDGVDITPFIAPGVSVLIAFVVGYVAMKNANNEKFNALSVQIATLQQAVNDLRSDVEKHNNVVERTGKLEADLNTAFKRIDELKARDEKLESRMEKFHG